MDKGLKILLGAYGGGGRPYTRPGEDDYLLAKAEGYMFDPVELTHEETLQRLRSVVKKYR